MTDVMTAGVRALPVRREAAKLPKRAGSAGMGPGRVRGGYYVMGWIRKHGEAASNIATVVLVIAGAIGAWAINPAVKPIGPRPHKPACPLTGQATAKNVKKTASLPGRVSSARSTLIIFVGRDGHEEYRQSSPLTIQNGQKRFAAGTHLCTSTSDFVRSDGLILPANQISSQAVVSNDGENVTVSVWVAPRYGHVSGFGSYSGTISLNDSRATGASVPVRINVQYPYVNRVLLWGLLLACAGLIWGLMVRKADKALPDTDDNGSFFANLALRVAVLATAVPIINIQVLSKPGWTGTLSQYLTLGGLVGAAAIAATPSFRALVSQIPKSARTQADPKKAAPAEAQPAEAQPAAGI